MTAVGGGWRQTSGDQLVRLSRPALRRSDEPSLQCALGTAGSRWWRVALHFGALNEYRVACSSSDAGVGPDIVYVSRRMFSAATLRLAGGIEHGEPAGR